MKFTEMFRNSKNGPKYNIVLKVLCNVLLFEYKLHLGLKTILQTTDLTSSFLE